VLESAEECSSIHQPAITPAVMFSLQSGLASLWRSSGIEPEILIGHSFGEVTAAYLGSAIDQDAVAHLVTYRGSIRDHIDRVGAMAAIGLGSKDIQKYLPSDGSIEIGAYNSPSMVTLSGDADAIDLLLEKLKKLDPQIQTHKLDLDFAWHSSWLEPVEKLFKKSVGPVRWTAPKRHVISTVTGKLESCFDTDYWWRNLRYPVKYQNAIDLALMMGANTFI
jgi:acyl transferase domain-containing protein